MKSQVAYLVMGAVLLLGPVAYAQQGTYVELGVAPVRISGGGASVTPDVVMARLGYDFNKNFSAELMAGTTFRSDSIGGVDFKVDSLLGAYLKARVEVARGLELFAKAGYVETRLSVSGAGSGSDSAFSYAAGAQYRFTKTVYGQLDYGSFYDQQGLRIAGPSLSVGVRF